MRYHTQSIPNPEFATNPNAARYIVEQVSFTAEEEAQRDAEEAAALAEQPRLNALAEINRLESLETPRRLAEAVLTTEGKTWLANNRALIAVERAKL